ncbi:MAG: hypothetical protein QOJ65_958 [Fimbriimonadaceae bacterium]|jgi:hypothetical protein|nr:hypothetical protein [Fimbriimonadaceae bacterium]
MNDLLKVEEEIKRSHDRCETLKNEMLDLIGGPYVAFVKERVKAFLRSQPSLTNAQTDVTLTRLSTALKAIESDPRKAIDGATGNFAWPHANPSGYLNIPGPLSIVWSVYHHLQRDTRWKEVLREVGIPGTETVGDLNAQHVSAEDVVGRAGWPGRVDTINGEYRSAFKNLVGLRNDKGKIAAAIEEQSVDAKLKKIFD